MGALGTLMAIGLFDIQGGASVNPKYEITSPLFDRIIIRLDKRYYKGKKLVIETVNNSPENVYIQKVTWNGKDYPYFQIAHEELTRGGKLVVELGSTPNKHWGMPLPN